MFGSLQNLGSHVVPGAGHDATKNRSDMMSAAGFGCRVARVAALIALALVAGVAHAGDHRFSVLLDTDNNPATGCTVATSKGPVPGVEQVWTTVVTTTASNIV